MNKTDEQLFSILKGANINNLKTINQNQILSSTHIVFGQSQSGKSSILKLITDSANLIQQAGLLYSYYHTNIAGKKSILQLYEVSGDAFQHLKILPVTHMNVQQVSFFLVIDLSENPSDLLKNLESQLQQLRQQQDQLLLKILTPQQYQSLEQQTYKQIESNPDRNKIRPLFLPVTIVGWKYDQFSKNLDVEVRKWISRGLRYLSLLNNATLVFGSQNDVSLVKQAFQNQFSSVKINQNDHMKMIYITKGTDIVEQIGLPILSTSQIQPLDAINKIIKEQVVVNPNPVKKNTKKVMNEQDWQQYKEDKIDIIKQEKERYAGMNQNNFQ